MKDRFRKARVRKDSPARYLVTFPRMYCKATLSRMLAVDPVAFAAEGPAIERIRQHFYGRLAERLRVVAAGSCEGLPNSTDGLAALKRLVTHPSCGIVLPLSP